MGEREKGWSGTAKSQGMLHQRRQELEARKHRSQNVTHNSEAFIRQTFVNKPFKARVEHFVDPLLRQQQARGFFSAILDNACRIAGSTFRWCFHNNEIFLKLLLPAKEAREMAILATVMALLLIAFAAAKEAPFVYSAAAHSIHSKAVMSELRSLI